MSIINRVTPTQEVFKQWKKYKRYIESIASRYCVDPFEYEEAIDESYLIVDKVYNRYKSVNSSKLAAYMLTSIKRGLRRFSQGYLRASTYLNSTPRNHYHSKYETLSYVEDNEEKYATLGKNLDADLDSYLIKKTIKKYISCMPTKMKEVYNLIYDGNLEQRMTNTECANLLGVSHQYIHDIKKRGYKFLRNHIESKSKWIKDYIKGEQ